MKIFALLLLLAVPLWAQTETPAPSFEWKLRLTKGQTWMQTIRVRETRFQVLDFTDFRQPVHLRDEWELGATCTHEVLEETPDFFRVRTTFSKFNFTQRFKGFDRDELRSTSSRAVESAAQKTLLDWKLARVGRALAPAELRLLETRVNAALSLPDGLEDGEEIELQPPLVARFKALWATDFSSVVPQEPMKTQVNLAMWTSVREPVKAQLQTILSLKSFDAKGAKWEERGTFKRDGASSPPASGSFTRQLEVDARTGLIHSSRTDSKFYATTLFDPKDRQSKALWAIRRRVSVTTN